MRCDDPIFLSYLDPSHTGKGMLQIAGESCEAGGLHPVPVFVPASCRFFNAMASDLAFALGCIVKGWMGGICRRCFGAVGIWM